MFQSVAEYLTLGNAAQAYGVSVRTLLRYQKHGLLPIFKFGRGKNLVKRADLEKLLNENI